MESSVTTATAGWAFEQGPIRPPNEARSLLLRVTRNCPWNRCTFCPVYKGAKFSVRPVEDVKRDIDAIAEHVQALRLLEEASDKLHRADVERMAARLSPNERLAFDAALAWYCAGPCVRADGMRTVFLQDANSLVAKADDLVEILTHLRARFPSIERITSYARAQTLAVKEEDDLRSIAKAGLDRVHIGLESGSDAVLQLVQKGVSKAQQIEAGLKAKAAGMSVSEYVMPGLGGKPLSREHAIETADVINRVNPDYIRLRTLAIPTHVPLYDAYVAGTFQKCSDVEVAEEIVCFLEHLEGTTGRVKSDHILNLFGGLEGKLPDEKPRMMAMLRQFLAMDPHEQMLYQVGRRLGILSSVENVRIPGRRAMVEAECARLGITPDNADAVIEQIMRSFL